MPETTRPPAHPETAEAGRAEPTVPEALVAALPVPPGVRVETQARGLTIVLPRRALSQAEQAVKHGIGLSLVGLWLLFAGPFLAGFYETLADLARSPDMPLLAAPAVMGLLPMAWLALRALVNRVTIRVDGHAVTVREGPLPGPVRQQTRLDPRWEVVYDPAEGRWRGQVVGRSARGIEQWLLPEVRDARIGGFVALTLEQHRARQGT